MSNRYSLALGVAVFLALAHTASAQQAGTYSGTAADGSSISFTIGTDSSTGKLQVTSAGFGISDTCSPGGFTYNTGWGLSGDGSDLSGARGAYTYSFGYLYVTATLSFSKNTLKGTVENATPTLITPPSVSGEPKKAAYCVSKKQAYTATLQPESDTRPTGHPQAVYYGETIARH